MHKLICRSFATGRQPEGSSAGFWKKISLLVGLPVIVAVTALMTATKKPEPRPDFIPYEYLRMRSKNFPWGDGKRNFFYNPHNNPLREGYEFEECPCAECEKERQKKCEEEAAAAADTASTVVEEVIEAAVEQIEPDEESIPEDTETETAPEVEENE